MSEIAAESKPESNEQNDTKSEASNGVAEEKADPHTGLTEREVEAVRTHWATIWAAWKKTIGVDYFITLFEEYPSVKAFFHTFDGMTMEEIRGSKKLRAHIINFGNGLNSFIDNLEDPEVLVVLIQKMTTSHHRRKISVDEFKDAFKCFLKYAAEHSEVDEFTASAYTKTLATVSSVIDTQMKAIEAGTAPK